MSFDPVSYAMGTRAAGSGTTDYADLENKPQINGVTLSGNKSANDLGLTDDIFTVHYEYHPEETETDETTGETTTIPEHYTCDLTFNEIAAVAAEGKDILGTWSDADGLYCAFASPHPFVLMFKVRVSDNDGSGNTIDMTLIHNANDEITVKTTNTPGTYYYSIDFSGGSPQISAPISDVVDTAECAEAIYLNVFGGMESRYKLVSSNDELSDGRLRFRRIPSTMDFNERAPFFEDLVFYEETGAQHFVTIHTLRLNDYPYFVDTEMAKANVITILGYLTPEQLSWLLTEDAEVLPFTVPNNMDEPYKSAICVWLSDKTNATSATFAGRFYDIEVTGIEVSLEGDIQAGTARVVIDADNPQVDYAYEHLNMTEDQKRAVNIGPLESSAGAQDDPDYVDKAREFMFELGNVLASGRKPLFISSIDVDGTEEDYKSDILAWAGPKQLILGPENILSIIGFSYSSAIESVLHVGYSLSLKDFVASGLMIDPFAGSHT